MTLRDQLPQRISDPLFRIRSHVARRTGANDPVQERRKQREAERQPRVEPGLPSAIVGLVGHTHTVTPAITIRGTSQSVSASSVATLTSSCNAGEVLTGGGCDCGSAIVQGSAATNATTWRCRCDNQSPSSVTQAIQVVCLVVPITTSA